MKEVLSNLVPWPTSGWEAFWMVVFFAIWAVILGSVAIMITDGLGWTG
jgi:hypothetical protein